MTEPDCNPADYTKPDFGPQAKCRDDQVVLSECHSMYGGCYEVCRPGNGVATLCVDYCKPLCGCADGFSENENGVCVGED